MRKSIATVNGLRMSTKEYFIVVILTNHSWQNQGKLEVDFDLVCIFTRNLKAHSYRTKEKTILHGNWLLCQFSSKIRFRCLSCEFPLVVTRLHDLDHIEQK